MLRVINQGRERQIKVRDKLTIYNLKSIIAGKMEVNYGDIRILMNGQELDGQQRLADLGLEDNMSLEVS